MSSSLRAAVVKWSEHDGLSEAIGDELLRMGFEVNYFLSTDPIPEETDLVFCFGPYDRWTQVVCQAAEQKASTGIKILHWNTENPPDLRLPWKFLTTLGDIRAAFDRFNDSENSQTRRLVTSYPLSILNQKMHKFRYLGEYRHAHAHGWLDLLASSSKIYADLFTKNGLPTRYVPWGTSPKWFAPLGLPRDIDVLWFGKRRTSRRNRLLRQINDMLCSKNISVYLADNIEHPFIYGEERTRILNRAKITMNLLPSWYDNAFPYRFHVAAGNRSMVISEPILSHCPEYRPGVHYISAPPEKLVDTIQYYLEHQDEREQIAENAFHLVTEQMTMENSVRSLVGSLQE
jgi:hypothetical protein